MTIYDYEFKILLMGEDEGSNIKKERREKLNTIRTFLYIIFGSISLGISLVGLLF